MLYPSTSSFIVYDGNGTKVNSGTNISCYSTCNSYLHKKDHTVKIIKEESKMPVSLDTVKEYIDLLNKIGIFKIKFNFDEANRIYEFILDPKDYDCRAYWTGVMMCIRYLWEDEYNDKFAKIPLYFIALHKKYPDKDLLYNLLLSHVYLYKESSMYNCNHALVNCYSLPFELKDIQLCKDNTNSTFFRKEVSDKTITVDSCYEILKQLNI